MLYSKIVLRVKPVCTAWHISLHILQRIWKTEPDSFSQELLKSGANSGGKTARYVYHGLCNTEWTET